LAEIPYSTKLDAAIVLEDRPDGELFSSRSRNEFAFHGPLLKLERSASDIRFSLWGNQGFLYRLVLYLLEEKHKIFNFHACGLYDEAKHVLYVIAGGAGSGKTVYLLSGLARGLKLFSTETVHFRAEGRKIAWFKGSLVDNVRLGALIHDFPRFLPVAISGRAERDVWQKKIALDLSAHQYRPDIIFSPRVILLFPHIEEGRQGFILHKMTDERKAAKTIFDNLAQKIAETVVLYDRCPLTGFDTPALAAGRLKASMKFVGHSSVSVIASVLSNPKECWGDLLR
jgi:hypothetical protein